MAKNDTWDNVQNLSQTIRFNDPAQLPPDGDGHQAQGYTGITIVTNAQAISSKGGLRDIQKITVAGAPRATKYSPQELATMVKGSNNSTGNFLLAELTAVYTDALGGL